MDKFAITIPERGPLRLRCHLIVGENCAHICDRVLKNRRGGEFVKVIAVKRELKRTEYRIGIRSYYAFEQSLYYWRDKRRGGNGRSVCD